MEKHKFSIPNISCDHCVRAIKDELSDLDGVNNIEGDADKKTVTVEWEDPASIDLMKKALAEIDYPAQQPQLDEKIQLSRYQLSVISFLKTAFTELKESVFDSREEGPRLFFPNGIELISITLKVDKYFEVEFKVAGAEGVKGLLESKKSGLDPSAIVDIEKTG